MRHAHSSDKSYLGAGSHRIENLGGGAGRSGAEITSNRQQDMHSSMHSSRAQNGETGSATYAFHSYWPLPPCFDGLAPIVATLASLMSVRQFLDSAQPGLLGNFRASLGVAVTTNGVRRWLPEAHSPSDGLACKPHRGWRRK